MALEITEKILLESILADLKFLIQDIESVDSDVHTYYSTVGGDEFGKCFKELKERCEKAQRSLEKIK